MSSNLENYPAIIPIADPITAANIATDRPTTNEILHPYITIEKMSLPNGPVPNRKRSPSSDLPGGSKRLRGSKTKGSLNIPNLISRGQRRANVTTSEINTIPINILGFLKTALNAALCQGTFSLRP